MASLLAAMNKAISMFSKKQQDALEEDVDAQSTKRRRSYPVEAYSLHVSKRKKSSASDPDQSTRRIQSYPVLSSSVRISKRKPWGYDIFKQQSAQGRRSSLLRYYRTPLHTPKDPVRDSSVPGTRQVPPLDVMTDMTEAYRCGQCSMVFQEDGLLDIHLNRTHGHFLEVLGNEPEKIVEQGGTGNQQRKRKLSDTPFEDRTRARAVKRKVSVTVIPDDDDDTQDQPALSKEYITIEAVPKKRKRVQTSSKKTSVTRRKVSVTHIPDDDDLSDLQCTGAGHKSHIYVEDTRPSKRRRKTTGGPPKSPKTLSDGKDEVFRCAYCPEKFYSMAEKQDHVREGHPDNYAKLNARCKECPFRFRSIVDLDLHVKAVHIASEVSDTWANGKKKPILVNCFICNDEVAKYALRMHIQCEHPKAYHKKLKIAQIEKRYCPLCEELIPENTRSLKGHIREVHPSVFKRDLTVEEMLGPEKKWGRKWEVCPICDVRVDGGRLERHIELKHPAYYEF